MSSGLVYVAAAQHINFIFPRKRDSKIPKALSRSIAREFNEVQGFLLNKKGMPNKGRSGEFREIHSGDPKWKVWGDFPWRMRMAKVAMLGTGDVYATVMAPHAFPLLTKTPQSLLATVGCLSFLLGGNNRINGKILYNKILSAQDCTIGIFKLRL